MQYKLQFKTNINNTYDVVRILLCYIFAPIKLKHKIMAGRKSLPEGEKKIRIDPFVKIKMVNKLGKKKCEDISVNAIEKEFFKLDKLKK